ncbi:MAG: hypothetical protein PVH40_01895 [Gemmatimonadales bacterium]
MPSLLATAVPAPGALEHRRWHTRLRRAALWRIRGTVLAVNRAAEEELDLAIDAPEIALRSPGDLAEQIGIEAEQERLTIGHEAPVTTGLLVG